MSTIRIKKLGIKNYRSFGDSVVFDFPNSDYKKPVAIVGYNNSGKTNLLNSILYGITEKYVNRDTFSINDFHNRMRNSFGNELGREMYLKLKSNIKNLF